MSKKSHFSRRNWLKGIGAGAVALGIGSKMALAHDTTQQEMNAMQIDINGTTINYTVHGEGCPVLLLHGFVVDHEVMEGAFEPVFANRPGYQRIYPDFPGMGLSVPGEGVTTSGDILEVINEFAARVIDGNFLVSGFSYGAYIAQGMVHTMPERIDGMMLMSPVVAPADADRQVAEPVVFVRDEEAVAMIPEELAPIFLANTVIQTKPVLGRIMEEFTGSFTRADFEFVGQLREPENYALPFDVREMDATFDNPTLILTARQDSNVGYAQAYELLPLYPRATYAVLDYAGHGVYLEQDALFKLLVNEWLDRVDAM